MSGCDNTKPQTVALTAKTIFAARLILFILMWVNWGKKTVIHTYVPVFFILVQKDGKICKSWLGRKPRTALITNYQEQRGTYYQ